MCSQKLHDMAFSALIRTGMRFFDTNPSGRILNRFSKDIGAIDELLPKAILDAGQICLMMVGSLIVSCAVNPLFLIPIVFLGTVFYWIRKVYLKTSKNIKRMEGMSKQYRYCQCIPLYVFLGAVQKSSFYSTISRLHSFECYVERTFYHQSLLHARYLEKGIRQVTRCPHVYLLHVHSNKHCLRIFAGHLLLRIHVLGYVQFPSATTM